jgi:MFS family permease
MQGERTLYTRTFLTMSLANFFTTSSFGCFFLFPLFVSHLGGSKLDIGIVMGVFSLSSVLSRPWISSMIDRIGRKKSYTLGCAIMTALPLSYLLFHQDLSRVYPALLFARILHGIGLAFCFTSAFTYMADIIPETRLNEGMAMFGITGLSGMAIGPAIAELIIQHAGFVPFFLAASALGALGFILHLQIPESHFEHSPMSSSSFFSVFFRPKTLKVSLLAFLFGYALAASGGFVSPYAKEKDLAFISIYYLSYSGMAVLTRFAGGRLADRLGELRIIPYAMLLTGAGLLLLCFLGGETILVISGIMSGLGHGFLFPCLTAVALRDEPIAIRGKVTGAFTGSMDAGAFFGSILLGYIGERAGFPALFLTAGLSLFLGLVFFKLLYRARR